MKILAWASVVIGSWIFLGFLLLLVFFNNINDGSVLLAYIIAGAMCGVFWGAVYLDIHDDEESD